MMPASPALPVSWDELAAQAKILNNIVLEGARLSLAQRDELEGLWHLCHALLDHAKRGSYVMVVPHEEAVPPLNVTSGRVLLRALAATAPVCEIARGAAEGDASIATCCYCQGAVHGAAWKEDHFSTCPWILARRQFGFPVGAVIVPREPIRQRAASS